MKVAAQFLIYYLLQLFFLKSQFNSLQNSYMAELKMTCSLGRMLIQCDGAILKQTKLTQ